MPEEQRRRRDKNFEVAAGQAIGCLMMMIIGLGFATAVAILMIRAVL